MTNPAETVKTFLAMFEGPGGIEQAIRNYFTAETTWENVGMGITTGPDEAMAVMDQFSVGLGMKAMRVDNLAVAESGASVLTERIDNVLDADGNIVMAIRVMGIFEVEDGHIVRWRDYFDTAGFGAGG